MNDEKNQNKKETIIIFDSNVWLDLYKLPPTLIEPITKSIRKRSELFWLPKQVYLEFNRNVSKNRDYSKNKYKDTSGKSSSLINEAKNQISKLLNEIGNYDIHDAKNLKEKYNTSFDKLIKEIKSDFKDLEKDHFENIKCILSKESDIISDTVESLYKENSAPEFSMKELLQIYAEGELRYKYLIPPGHTDRNKDDRSNEEANLTRRFGDLIIWKEILRRVSDNFVEVILVQNEKKLDWWDNKQTNKISKLLEKEFLEYVSDNSQIQMISFDDFINIYASQLELPVASIKELKYISALKKSIIGYIQVNFHEIIKNVVELEFVENSLVDEEIYSNDNFEFGVEEISNVELVNLNIKNFEIIKEDLNDYLTVNCDLQVDFNAEVTEYENYYVSHYSYCTFSYLIDLQSEVSLDLSDGIERIEDRFEFSTNEIALFKFHDINVITSHIDVDIDEDMFRER